MKKIYFILLIFSILGCKKAVISTDLPYLNGYWEIKKVVLEDGSLKEYKANESLDFIELNNNTKGFRKKVVPQTGGKFITSDVVETIEIVEKNDDFYIKYATKFATWEEKIVELSKNELVLSNEHNFKYFYQRLP